MVKKENIVLEIKDLRVYFHLDEGLLKAVDGVDLLLRKGETLGILGESGCGKTVTTQAILRIVPDPGKVKGEILYYEDGNKNNAIDLVKLKKFGKTMQYIRGNEIAVIFQEPMKAFSPIHTIGNQISEAILLHVTNDKKEAKNMSIDIIKKVGIPNALQRYNEYPHQLSGGLRQRAMIAMAIACNPAILIADEPTTALDVTIQAQILDLINRLKEKTNSSIIYITHDLGVISEVSDNVAVMYLGKVIEYSDVNTLFYNAMHPYTVALLKSSTSGRNKPKAKLESIKGTVPVPMNLPIGCGYYDRCQNAISGVCNKYEVPMIKIEKNHFVRCMLFDKRFKKSDQL